MDGTTGIVLAVIFGLVALILGILNFATKNKESENKKLIKQTEFNVTGKTGGAKTHTLWRWINATTSGLNSYTDDRDVCKR